MTDNQKKWLISSGVTFLTGFLISIIPMLDELSVQDLGWATLGGLLLAGFRGGIKQFAEYLIKFYDNNR
jgi:hypothetical protein